MEMKRNEVLVPFLIYRAIILWSLRTHVSGDDLMVINNINNHDHQFSGNWSSDALNDSPWIEESSSSKNMMMMKVDGWIKEHEFPTFLLLNQ